MQNTVVANHKIHFLFVVFLFFYNFANKIACLYTHEIAKNSLVVCYGHEDSSFKELLFVFSIQVFGDTYECGTGAVPFFCGAKSCFLLFYTHKIANS
jgi:hypothetical protein